MQSIISKTNRKWLIYITLMIYFIISYLYLMKYPFIHSDETWLMGLSKTVLKAKSFAVSEPFFDLYPRAIHGLRVVFISLQLIFMKLLGDSISTLRLLSLMTSMISLWFSLQWVKKTSKQWFDQLLIILLIGFNIQFIMMSHMARQEAVILMFMVIAFYLYTQKFNIIIIASLIGLTMGIHPNSLLIGLGILLMIVSDDIQIKSFKNTIVYCFTLLIWLGIFIGISFLLNKNFLHDYFNYGKSLGVVNFDISRLKGFYFYYYKLFHQIGGTYLLVNIKLHLIITGIFYVITLSLILLKKSLSQSIMYPFLMITGINLGYFVIGRYNQTAIIFTIFFSLLLIYSVLKTFLSKKLFNVVMLLLIVMSLNISFNTIQSTHNEDYKNLSKEFTMISKTDNVLGNINMLEFFEINAFYDYRNLWSLSGEEVITYIKDHDIKYIIWPEEMSYIHKSGKWDILYGPLDYYESLESYLETCELLHTFESSTYGMRISKYVNTYPWSIKIYKVRL